MPKRALDRTTLAKFLPNHQAIVEFERLMMASELTPTTIEEAAALAGAALAAANQALAMLAEASELLAQNVITVAVQPVEPDDAAPASSAAALPDDFTPATVLHTHEPEALGIAATDLDSVIDLANAMRTALINNNLGT